MQLNQNSKVTINSNLVNINTPKFLNDESAKIDETMTLRAWFAKFVGCATEEFGFQTSVKKGMLVVQIGKLTATEIVNPEPLPSIAAIASLPWMTIQEEGNQIFYGRLVAKGESAHNTNIWEPTLNVGKLVDIQPNFLRFVTVAIKGGRPEVQMTGTKEHDASREKYYAATVIIKAIKAGKAVKFTIYSAKVAEKMARIVLECVDKPIIESRKALAAWNDVAASNSAGFEAASSTPEGAARLQIAKKMIGEAVQASVGRNMVLIAVIVGEERFPAGNHASTLAVAKLLENAPEVEVRKALRIETKSRQ